MKLWAILLATLIALPVLAQQQPRPAPRPPPKPPVKADPTVIPPPATNIGSSMQLLKSRFQPCRDKPMQSLVGQAREPALKKVREMRLMQVRVLNWRQSVNFEVVPERLTLVMNDQGQVIRAFCR